MHQVLYSDTRLDQTLIKLESCMNLSRPTPD